MPSENQPQWKATKACGLAVLGAALVVGIRLAAGTAQPEFLSAAIPENSGKEAEADFRLLLAPGREAELERHMEERPGDVMASIDTMEDRELALKLTTDFVKSVQGLHYDLLLNWLTRQKDKRIASAIFRGLVPRLVRENPDECIALGFGLGDGTEARMARDEIFFALPFEQRVRLLEQQDPEERAWLLSRRATSFGERAPELCLDMIKALPESDNRREAMAKLMKAWINGANVFHLSDPVSAVKGVLAIEDPEMRKDALRIATFEWSQNHADIASEWITRLPAGPDRDAAIGGLVNRLAKEDPETATNWAGSIADEGLRLDAIERIGKETSDRTPITR